MASETGPSGDWRAAQARAAATYHLGGAIEALDAAYPGAWEIEALETGWYRVWSYDTGGHKRYSERATLAEAIGAALGRT